jgi:hypothetical protein
MLPSQKILNYSAFFWVLFVDRLTIGFWSSRTYPDFGFEKAGHTKIQSIFRENRGLSG